MSCPNSACCVVVLNQQQQENIEHHNESLNGDSVNQGKTKSKNCTVIENGLVVVKPLQAPIKASPANC